MHRISVIIPVFNAAPYLRQCLDSVLAQTLEDIEVICVNDCSTDASLDILSEYAEADPRICLINLPVNHGPGYARNVALECADGEYLGFVDSDDWIEPDFFQQMYDKAALSGADVVYNDSILREFPDSSSFKYQLPWSPKLSEKGRFIDEVISANYALPMLYMHIYRKSLVLDRGFRFPESYKTNEDRFFNVVASVFAGSIYAFSGPLYHYRKTRDSLTDKYTIFGASFVECMEDLKNFFGDRIYERGFRVKLFYVDAICSEIGSEPVFRRVRSYLQGLQEYFDKSGVFVSDYDRYVISNILEAESCEDLQKRIGSQPRMRYNTRERIRAGQNVRLSVIIPVYNTEGCLGRCLMSVCSQTLHDIEILCVNDCSTDDSKDVIMRFASEDNRIRLIDLPDNGGVGNARNIGLAQAAGKYVYFMDSDDWIDDGYLEEMLRNIGERDAVINSHFINESDDIARSNASDYPFISREGAMIPARYLQRHFPPAVWCRMFKKSFLVQNGITFPVVKGGAEDISFPYSADLALGSVFAYKGKYSYHCCQWKRN